VAFRRDKPASFRRASDQLEHYGCIGDNSLTPISVKAANIVLPKESVAVLVALRKRIEAPLQTKLMAIFRASPNFVNNRDAHFAPTDSVA
jgi:hypothetical protein